MSMWRSVPEPGNLFQLARVFAVTTDRLLGDVCDEPASSPNAHAHSCRSQAGSTLPHRVDRFLLRARRPTGVYLMLIGLSVSVIGGIGRLMFGTKRTTFGISSMQQAGEAIIYAENGNTVIDGPVNQSIGDTASAPFGQTSFPSL